MNKFEEKIRDMVSRLGIDPRKVCICTIPVKSDRKEAVDGADK